MEYGFLIFGIIVGFLFGLFIGAQAGAGYMAKRIKEIDEEIKRSQETKYFE